MNPDVTAFIYLALAAQQPLAKWGVTIDAIEPGSVTLTCPIAEDMTTAGTGIVMGGVIALMADVAAGLSVIALMDSPRPVTTLDFTAHQITAAKGERLVIVGKAERIAKTIAVSGAETFSVADGFQCKCARLTATFLVA